eukprot:scaffold14354_cov85-Amphora_coffeaeformis.AAC.1
MIFTTLTCTVRVGVRPKKSFALARRRFAERERGAPRAVRGLPSPSLIVVAVAVAAGKKTTQTPREKRPFKIIGGFLYLVEVETTVISCCEHKRQQQSQ